VSGRAGSVLFIVIDQLRADCVAGALAGAVDLPNIRALMAESVVFDNHFTVTAPCGPARASLLTGLYAMNHRSVRNGAPLDAKLTNLAIEARKAGYDPLLFGYTDTSVDPRGRDPEDPDLRSYEGLMPGFNERVQMRFETSVPWVEHLRARGYDLPEQYWGIFAPQGGLGGPAPYRAEDSDTAYLADGTLAALAGLEGDWFAHVTFIRPHPPLTAPAPYHAMYDPDGAPGPDRIGTAEDLRAAHPFYDAFFGEPANKGLYIGFDGRMDRMGEGDARKLRAAYFGLASEVDLHVGRLLDFLRESGREEETLVVLTADHGEMLGDHFMWGKESPHDPAFHIPLMIRDPRRREAAGTRVAALTESIDLAPTILEWLGLPVPPGFNGASLIPFLDGGAPERWRDHMFIEYDLADPAAPTRYQRLLGLRLEEANFAILREARWKLVHFNGGLPPMLFDLEADPREHRDLGRDPAHGAEIARLRAKMLDHRMTFADHALSRMALTGEGVVEAERE
jgi:arylsulfatase A-like enzyme